MRHRPTWPLAVILTVLGIWLLAGCGETPPAHTEVAPEEPEPPPEPAPSEHVHAHGAEELSVSPDEDISVMEIENLGGVVGAGSEETRAQALKALTDLLLHHSDAEIRVTVARTLSVAADQAAKALVQAAMTDSAPEVREAAAEALQHASPSPWLYERLARLREADDALTRAAAFKAEMGVRLNDPDRQSALRWLTSQLGKRRDDVSAQAAMKMHHHLGASALPYAIEALESSTDALQREVAACVIAVICAGTSPRQQEFAKLAKAEMKEVLEAPEPANLKGLKPLERALSEDASPEVRAIAAQGLGYLGQPGSARVLGRALHDPAEPVRWWAASSLMTVPGDAAVDDLAHAATRDESERVRRGAVRALGWIEDKGKVVAPLVDATEDKSAEVRRAAAVELGRIADPEALAPLTKLFDDESEEVRWAAVVAVGNLREPASAPLLAKAVRDESPMVANAAERALQKMGIAERRYGTRDEM